MCRRIARREMWEVHALGVSFSGFDDKVGKDGEERLVTYHVLYGSLQKGMGRWDQLE